MDLDHRLEGRFIKPKVARYFEPADPPPFIEFETARHVNMYALAEAFTRTTAAATNGAAYACTPAYVAKPGERGKFAQLRLRAEDAPMGFVLETKFVAVEDVNKAGVEETPAMLKLAHRWTARRFSLYPVFAAERDRRDPARFEEATKILDAFVAAYVGDPGASGPPDKSRRGAWQRLPKTNPSP